MRRTPVSARSIPSSIAASSLVYSDWFACGATVIKPDRLPVSHPHRFFFLRFVLDGFFAPGFVSRSLCSAFPTANAVPAPAMGRDQGVDAVRVQADRSRFPDHADGGRAGGYLDSLGQ